jgi:pyruvate decarboxylase
MPETIKLAEYLFTRLHQLGVGSIHGVPGDYNLTLLDYVEPSGIHWVGNCNELNAGYAADGYAKVNGIGALITTFGVGELSAINAIAGAYTERAPLVHIVGTPVRDSQDNRRLIHHTFNDGEYGRFALMAAQVTVAQTSIRDARTSPEQIDHVLLQCLIHSRPVYIQVPVDLVSVAVSSERLNTPLKVPHGIHVSSHDDAFAQIFDKIYSAKQPAILVDGEIRALNIIQEVSKLVESTKWPTWTTTYAKSLVDESLPNVHGIYQGTFSPQKAQDFWNSCDLILCFGPHYSNTNTYAYTSIPKAAITISFSDTDIKLGADTVFRDMPAKHALKHLLKLDYKKIHSYDPYPSIPKPDLVTSSNVDNTAALTQSTLWPLLAKFLQPGDIIFGETGTAGYGCRVMPIPKHARLFTPVTWLSIGYMLPAAQGAALAQRELLAKSKWGAPDQTTARTILLIGDGSFQMTAQELSTIIRENLNVVVFLINNDGYTIERCIHGLKQGYNDIAFWRYLQVPAAFGAKDGTYTKSAKTPGELEAVLGDEKLISGEGLRMVEIVLDREDAPAGILTKMIDAQKEIEAKKGNGTVNRTAK